MFTFFLFLSFLVNFANLQNPDEVIDQCVKDVAKTLAQQPPESKKRPTVDPTSCFDLDAGSCTLFNLQNPAIYVTNLNNNP